MNVKKAKTETDQGNFNIFEKAFSGSTNISGWEFSVADDVIMEDQNIIKKSAKVFTENKELAPLSNKLNKLEDQLYQYIFKNMTDEE